MWALVLLMELGPHNARTEENSDQGGNSAHDLRVQFPPWPEFSSVLVWAQSLQELVALLDAAYIFFGVSDVSPCSWCCDTAKMCYIFFSELRKDKIATWLRLPPVVFCHLPLLGRHVTSLNQGLSWGGEMKDLGNEVETSPISCLLQPVKELRSRFFNALKRYFSLCLFIGFLELFH